MVQPIYPGFSRGSILAHSRTNNPTYQGMAARKKPIINLQKNKQIKEQAILSLCTSMNEKKTIIKSLKS